MTRQWWCTPLIPVLGRQRQANLWVWDQIALQSKIQDNNNKLWFVVILYSSFIWFLSHYLPSNPLTIGRRERRLEGRRSIDIDLFRLLLPAVRGVRFLGASPVSPNSNPANQQFSKCNSSGSSCLWPFQGSQFIPFPEFPELNHLQLAKIMPLLEHETIIVNGFRQTEAGPYPTPGI